MTKRTRWILAATFLSLLVAGASHAGQRYISEVQVSPGRGSGSLGSARNSADTLQYIYCQVRTYKTSAGTNQVVCAAQDRTPTGFVSCQSTEPQMVEAVRSMTSSSYIVFTVEGSECLQIQLYNDSRDPPKAP